MGTQVLHANDSHMNDAINEHASQAARRSLSHRTADLRYRPKSPNSPCNWLQLATVPNCLTRVACCANGTRPAVRKVASYGEDVFIRAAGV